MIITASNYGQLGSTPRHRPIHRTCPQRTASHNPMYIGLLPSSWCSSLLCSPRRLIIWEGNPIIRCTASFHRRSRERGGRRKEKIFSFKFFLSCHKIWILFHTTYEHYLNCGNEMRFVFVCVCVHLYVHVPSKWLIVFCICCFYSQPSVLPSIKWIESFIWIYLFPTPSVQVIMV